MKPVWVPFIFLVTAGIGTVSYLKKDLLIDRIPRLRAVREAEPIASKAGSKIDNMVAAFSSEVYLLLSQGMLDADTHKDYARYLYYCQSESILPLTLSEWKESGAPVWE